MSQALLGEGKDSDSPYDRMDEINRRFREDKPALARYNLQDCRLVTRIFEHTHLTEFLLARAAVTGLAPDRMGALSPPSPIFICRRCTVKAMSHRIPAKTR